MILFIDLYSEIINLNLYNYINYKIIVVKKFLKKLTKLIYLFI